MQNEECRMHNERTAKMREILFRGKRKDNGEWVEGSYLYCFLPNTDWTGQPKGKAEEVHYIVDKNNINYAVIPETVGQYTMTKYTDEQVKNALELIASGVGGAKRDLCIASLDLIERQEAEIKKLERTISHLEDYCNALPDQIRSETAEETKCEPIDRCINIVEERARLQRYVKIIIAAINYKGTADHEDVLSILREFETENLDLLNRDECDKQLLEAEIERLTKYNDKLIEEVDNLIYACDYAKQEAIKEFAKKIDELLKRYSHLHELAEKVRHSTEEYADGTPIEMVSVWEVLSLKKNEMVDYETMNDLQDNIEVIAKERLLTEFEKDFRLLVKEMDGESK